MNKETIKLLKESQRFFTGKKLIKEEFDPEEGAGENLENGEPPVDPSLESGTGEENIQDFSDAVSDVLECEEEELDEVFGKLLEDLEAAQDNGETKVIVNIQDVLDLLNGYITE